MAAHKEFDMGAGFAGLDFHSIRLEERFIRTMETLIRQPDKSIWGASEDRAEASDYGPQLSTGCWEMTGLTGKKSKTTGIAGGLRKPP
jgi:hypothetical protein